MIYQVFFNFVMVLVEICNIKDGEVVELYSIVGLFIGRVKVSDENRV